MLPGLLHGWVSRWGAAEFGVTDRYLEFPKAFAGSARERAGQGYLDPHLESSGAFAGHAVNPSMDGLVRHFGCRALMDELVACPATQQAVLDAGHYCRSSMFLDVHFTPRCYQPSVDNYSADAG